jgi:hypothetical protein
MAMLIHHGERNNMANSEFSDILYFMVHPGWPQCEAAAARKCKGRQVMR